MKLSKEAQGWHDKIKTAYSINSKPSLLILQTAFEAFDMMREAEKSIKKHGMVVIDRYNQLKSNPACAVVRDSRAQMLQALKALNLDIDPKEIISTKEKKMFQ